MKTSEALKIVGGLSKPSKMPGWAYGLPAAECKTGLNWHNSQTQFAAVVMHSRAVTFSPWFRLHNTED